MKNLTEKINEELFSTRGYPHRWSMTHPEKFTLDGMMALLKPSVSIEIGAAFGGSLQVIEKYSQKVYSVDIEQERIDGLKTKFPSVQFLCGYSGEVLPEIFKSEKGIGFVLIDGDHSYEGVQKDIALLMSYQPQQDLYVIMHDSFNPEVRKGIVDFSWEQSPYFEYLEVDFVQGLFHQEGKWNGYMWGGFALAKFSPERVLSPVRSAHHQGIYDSCISRSVHALPKKNRFQFWK